MRARPSSSIVKVAASEDASGSKRKHITDNERLLYARKRAKLGQLRLQPEDITLGYDNFKFLKLPSGQCISHVRRVKV